MGNEVLPHYSNSTEEKVCLLYFRCRFLQCEFLVYKAQENFICYPLNEAIIEREMVLLILLNGIINSGLRKDFEKLRHISLPLAKQKTQIKYQMSGRNIRLSITSFIYYTTIKESLSDSRSIFLDRFMRAGLSFAIFLQRIFTLLFTFICDLFYIEMQQKYYINLTLHMCLYDFNYIR